MPTPGDQGRIQTPDEALARARQNTGLDEIDGDSWRE